MVARTAGIVLYRCAGQRLEVFLIHMGGPIWARRDALAWSIPKGGIGPNEDPLAAAVREFSEETGFSVSGDFELLGTFRQNKSKDLIVWALKGDCDPKRLRSNHFTMEWPPHSGEMQSFPEADRGDWFDHARALTKVIKGQRPVLERFFAAHR